MRGRGCSRPEANERDRDWLYLISTYYISLRLFGIFYYLHLSISDPQEDRGLLACPALTMVTHGIPISSLTRWSEDG